MSLRVMTKVFAYSEATLAARLVLLVIADAAHDDGVTWISHESIREKALVSQATVSRSIDELEAAGELEKRKAQRGRIRINVYRVVVPGLAEVKYEDLPFELSEPFTTSHPEKSSDGDNFSSCAPTTSHPVDFREGGTALKVFNGNRTVKEPPPSPPADLDAQRSKNRPAKVDRQPVTDTEYHKALAALAAFNRTATTSYSSTDWIAKIIMRIREHPDLSVFDHADIVERAFADQWWKGPPSPSVVYGNAGIFERCITAVGTASPAQGLTPTEMEQYETTWGPGTPYKTPAEARAGENIIDAEYEEIPDGMLDA